MAGEAGPREPVSVEALSLTSAPEASGPASGETALARPNAASLVGQTLSGRYLVTALIGSGGMGAVYRAEHVQLQKPVALKVLNAEMALHKEAALRFEREAMVSARIMHPHVVSANDSGRLPDGSLYLVLEFVSGRSLRQLIDEEGRVPPPRALAIAGQIAEALAAAHAAEVVHRDLKPGNVMLLRREGNSEFVKVLDFGLARIIGQPSTSEPLTRTGAIFGTPEYMSPEQARGEVADHRADLYSLGVILYELLAGRPPFQAPELVAVLIKHIQEAPPPLPADIPEPLARYVASLLEKQPADRPADALQVVKALRRLGPAPGPFSLVPPRAKSDASVAGPRLRQRALQIAAGALPALRHGLEALRGLARADGHPARRVAAIATLLLTLIGVVLLLWPRHSNPELEQRASRGQPEALGELAKVPSAKRTAAASLALGRGYLNTQKAEPALDAFSAALKADPELTEHIDLLRGVRRLVDDSSTRDRALELAATRLGARGVDLLFDVWLATKEKTAATRGAREWLDSAAVRAAASPAAKLALELREAKGCSALRELLPRARDAGDERSLAPLKRLQAKSGCGFLGLKDCYSCLRGEGALEQAQSAVSDRPAPRFDAK
ncbi:MAG: serine/threonine-protein kinase [Deltaproteobacteria bacterium]